jgi:hypothetical protein
MADGSDGTGHVSIYCTRRVASITPATVLREYRDIEIPSRSTLRKECDRIARDTQAELPGWTVSVQQLSQYEITIAREKLNQQSGL